jgi:hypothetical protein
MFQYSLSGADIKKDKLKGFRLCECGSKSIPHKSMKRGRRKYIKMSGKSSRRREIGHNYYSFILGFKDKYR